jgi:hypothetical protein
MNKPQKEILWKISSNVTHLVQVKTEVKFQFFS